MLLKTASNKLVSVSGFALVFFKIYVIIKQKCMPGFVCVQWKNHLEKYKRNKGRGK